MCMYVNLRVIYKEKERGQLVLHLFEKQHDPKLNFIKYIIIKNEIKISFNFDIDVIATTTRTCALPAKVWVSRSMCVYRLFPTTKKEVGGRQMNRFMMHVTSSPWDPCRLFSPPPVLGCSWTRATPAVAK